MWTIFHVGGAFEYNFFLDYWIGGSENLDEMNIEEKRQDYGFHFFDNKNEK